MKIFGYFITVIIILIAAPVICWMMETGDPSFRALGLLLAVSLAGIFNVIQKMSESNKPKA